MKTNTGGPKKGEEIVWPRVHLKPVVWPFTVLLIALCGFFLWVLFKHETSKITWWPFLVIGGFSVLAHLSQKYAGLKLDHQGMTRNFVGGRSMQVKWENVSSATMRWHTHIHGVNLFLEIESHGAPKMLVPLSLYGRKSIVTMAKYVDGLATGAKISDRIRRFASGDLPWYMI